MLIYGNKATKTGHQDLFGVKCPHCQTKDSLEMYTFSRYAHLFWIPLFPYKKEAVTQCNHCKQVLTKKEFNGELLDRYEEMKKQARTPIWQFIGLFLFGILVATVLYSAAEDEKRDKQYLAEPKAGDIYEIKTEDGNYTLYKVAAIKSDSVYVMFNKYQSTARSGLSKNEITAMASFIKEDLSPIAKHDLLNMKTKGEILRVKRD